MAVTFLEPGGDATSNVAAIGAGGFWKGSTASLSPDFVRGNHINAIAYGAGDSLEVITNPGILNDAGTRLSLAVYFLALPFADTVFSYLLNSDGTAIILNLQITSAGALQLVDAVGTQIGSNGATLSTGKWYQIALAYTITSTTVNRFELFVVDDTLNFLTGISGTNVTITNTGTSEWLIGNDNGDLSMDFRSSDHYVDNSNSLTYPGNIWVTAKRPVSNGTTNDFNTQIGVGGSGYGSGHSPQVNERPLNTANGWSKIGAGSAVTEEYTIEAKNVGDIDISTATILDFMGWVDASSITNETASIIVANSLSNISLTASAQVFTKIAGSSTYPTGGTDIGIKTDTTLTTVGLYECGIVVAYIPAVVTNNDAMLAFF